MTTITKLNKDTTLLKIIALITMIIDHVGLVFFSEHPIFRIIGRISFPIFTYTCMIGYFKTKDLKKYILRLLLLAIFCQPIYNLTFGLKTPNVLFTLVLELILYYILDKKEYIYVLVMLYISLLIPLDYGIIYLFLVPIFYYTRNNKHHFTITYTIYYSLYFIIGILTLNTSYLILSFSLLSLPLLIKNTNTNIKLNKYIFYICYPLHLIIIYLIKIF